MYLNKIKLHERIEHTLGAVGDIDPAGQLMIKAYVQKITGYDKWHRHDDFGWAYKNDKGAFTKRFSKLIHDATGVNLTPAQLNEVGRIATEHTNTVPKYFFDFDDKLDWKAGDFGDGGSCFMPKQSTIMYTLRHYGVRAVRFYPDGEAKRGVARAFVNDTDDIGAVIWNAYGYDKMVVARVLADFFKADVRPITLTNNGDASGDVYVNSGTAMLIAPHDTIEATLKKFTEFDLGYSLHTDPEYKSCVRCKNDKGTAKVMLPFGKEGKLCEACYARRMATCALCAVRYPDNYVTSIMNEAGAPTLVCHACCVTAAVNCIRCNSITIKGKDGDARCRECRRPGADIKQCMACQAPVKDASYVHPYALCQTCRPALKNYNVRDEYVKLYLPQYLNKH